ncbi:MAG TPA: carboxypeptidase-like regulatory domain-containing protein [Bryobacteraceae bacterium]
MLIRALCAGQTGDVRNNYSGPVAPANGHAYTITGSVSNSVTGEPVRRALVHIGQSAAFSGADGRFQIEGVLEGQYSAVVQRPGFFDPAQAGSFAVPAPMITVGPNAPPVALTLIPESVIEGRVLNNTGEPVENAQVQVISEQILRGRKTLQVTGILNTDDAGEYRIENLSPGKYYVQILQQPVFGWSNGIAAEGRTREVYPEQFYPNVPDLASAQALPLGPGENVRADFTAAPKATVRVSGVTVPAAPNGIFATLQDANGGETQVGIQVNPRTGKWTLPFVPPGTWNLVFRAQDQPGEAYYAEQRIEVRGSDIENLQIALQPLPAIPVHVLNAVDAQAQSVQIRLISQNAQRLNRQEFVPTTEGGKPSGALVLRDVPPGVYTVEAQSNGPLCVDSVSSGSNDLTRDPLVVALGSPPQPIQVGLREDCASLVITAQSQVGVILVSDSKAFEPKVTSIGPSTEANFGMLAPGAYRLYGVASNPYNLEYTNPDVLRNLEAQEIILVPHATVAVSATASGRASQ